jgi:hypothetical protein
MFCMSRPRQEDNNIVVLPWVWSYLYKIDRIPLKDVEKSRGVRSSNRALATEYENQVEGENTIRSPG